MLAIMKFDSGKLPIFHNETTEGQIPKNVPSLSFHTNYTYIRTKYSHLYDSWLRNKQRFLKGLTHFAIVYK